MENAVSPLGMIISSRSGPTSSNRGSMSFTLKRNLLNLSGRMPTRHQVVLQHPSNRREWIISPWQLTLTLRYLLLRSSLSMNWNSQQKTGSSFLCMRWKWRIGLGRVIAQWIYQWMRSQSLTKPLLLTRKYLARNAYSKGTPSQSHLRLRRSIPQKGILTTKGLTN